MHLDVEIHAVMITPFLCFHSSSVFVPQLGFDTSASEMSDAQRLLEEKVDVMTFGDDDICLIAALRP